jgi:hypothetical protein
MKRTAILLLAAGLLTGGIAYVAVGNASAKPPSAPADPAQPVDPGHGTHLCSEDEHCGAGHKCCDGHCMMVSTCG